MQKVHYAETLEALWAEDHNVDEPKKVLNTT